MYIPGDIFREGVKLFIRACIRGKGVRSRAVKIEAQQQMPEQALPALQAYKESSLRDFLF